MIISNKQVIYVDTYAGLPSSADDGDIALVQDTRLVFLYDATASAWAPSSRLVIKKSMVQVNGKSAGSTALYTMENLGSLKFYPTHIVPRSVNISNVVTAPTVSIGTNAGSYNNIATASVLDTILSTISVGSGAPKMTTTSPPLSNGDVIFANVTTPAAATNYTVRYDIVGYYDF